LFLENREHEIGIECEPSWNTYICGRQSPWHRTASFFPLY
jgi:hypothetical protein